MRDAASTRFVVEGTRMTGDGRSYSLVRCELETGRQHQIRVHLASLGAPIVGDKLYGPDETCFARGDAKNDKLLARICRMPTYEWKSQIRKTLEPFFNLTEGLWRQKRLEKEWAYCSARGRTSCAPKVSST